MSNRFYTSNPDRKVLADAGGMTIPKAGSSKSVSPIKTASWPGLPGPASNAFAKFKAGAKEVNGYAMYNGLSKAHPGFKAVQSKIAKQGGYSMERAGAILAASSRGASKAAHRKNPRLNRVKG